MDSYKITEALRRRLDIERLRPMQAKMMDTRSRAVMLAAPTGSGKTVAFGCYMLRRVGEPCGKVQAVVTKNILQNCGSSISCVMYRVIHAPITIWCQSCA